MKGWAGWWIAVAAAVALGIIGTTPPAPLPADAASTAFSASRAMTDVRRVAATPHTTGTAEDAAVRAYLTQRLRGMGLEVREADSALSAQASDRIAEWSKGKHRPTRLVNVIGVLPGKDRNAPAVALMTHHDTVWGSPGAADDTAGVATILETIRAVRAGGQPARDVIVVITDAEETGLEGAKAFFASDPLRQRIGTIINLEARGGGGRTTMFQTMPGNGAAMRLYAENVSRPGASSLAAYVYSVLPNDTDLSMALTGGWSAYNFAFIGRPGLYHSPKATPDRLDQGALQDMGGQVLALTKALLAAPALPERSKDAVFFDVFGQFLAIYPPWLGWVMLGVAALGLGAAWRSNRNWRALGSGALRMLVLLVATAATLFALNWISGEGPQANYYDRLASIPQLELMVALTGCGMFLLMIGKSATSRPAQIGAALLLALLGALVQTFAPTAAYVVVLPVLLTALAIWLNIYRAVALVVAALVLGYMIYLGHFIMQGVGASIPFAAGLPISLAVMALLPMWPGTSAKTAQRGGLALLGLALLTALWVRYDPLADTVAVYSSDKSIEAIPVTKPQ